MKFLKDSHFFPIFAILNLLIRMKKTAAILLGLFLCGSVIPIFRHRSVYQVSLMKTVISLRRFHHFSITVPGMKIFPHPGAKLSSSMAFMGLHSASGKILIPLPAQGYKVVSVDLPGLRLQRQEPFHQPVAEQPGKVSVGSAGHP